MAVVTCASFPMTRFAKRLDQIEMSGIRKIFELSRGMTDAIDLSLGQPHFDTPPEIKRAAIEAIENGENRYTVTQGRADLREALGTDLEKNFGFQGGGTMVTSGAAGGLFLALAALVEEGDEVVVPDPYFVLYCHLVRFFGGTPVLLDTYPDFRVTPENLEEQISPRTRIILFNNPVNPTGIAYTKEEVAAIAAVAKKHNVIVLSDEIYSAFSYDFPHESMMRHHDRTILVGGFSKTYAIPGWRLGFAAGPEDIINKMSMLQQFSYVCAPSPAQVAGITALGLDMSSYIDPYRKKRDMVYEGLKDNFEVVRPQGAFYIFPKCPRLEQTLLRKTLDAVGEGADQEFVRRAVENKLLVVPGSACSHHNTHFRLSFAASDEDLKKGIDILNRIARF